MTLFKRVARAAFACWLLSGAMALVAQPAMAQFDEIIVSARKVDESLQDVPLSITALSAEKIERAGITNLNDIAAFTPGLSFFNPIGDFLPTPIIRGVAQTDIFGETNVGSYVDGVYVAGREGLNFNFLDVERIEIVKGPQSALYGRNSFSGTINYVTKRAPDEFEIKTDVTAGSDSRLEGRLQIGGPLLGDTLKGYVAVGYSDFDGTYEDNLGGNDVGGAEYQTILSKLEWLVSEDFEVIGTIYYSDDEIDISPTASLPMNCENIRPGTNPGRPAAFCGKIPDLDTLNDRLTAAGYPNSSGDDTVNKVRGDLGEDRELTRASLNINWDLDFGTLTFLTGYSKTEQEGLDDGSRNLGNKQPFEYCLFGPGGPGFPNCIPPLAGILETGLLQPTGQDETDEWSQEIRFTSPQDREFRFGGGAYYFNSEFNTVGGGGGVIANQPLPAGFLGPFGPFVAGGIFGIGDGAFLPWFSPNGDTDSSKANVDQEIESWAGFTWAELDLFERLTIRAELRYTYQEEDLETLNLSIDPGTGTVTDRAFQAADDDWDFWTGRLSLQYRPSDDWMLYGTVANGTKSGFLESLSGTELVPGPGPGDPPTSRDFATNLSTNNEKNISYEIGAKGTTADGRMQLNVAGFYIDWSDAAIRSTIEVNPDTGLPLEIPTAVTQIVGEASIWGWEASIDWAPTDKLYLGGGISYQDAEWDDARLASLIEFPSYGDDACLDPATAPDYCGRIDGNQMARQPPWQANVTAQYTQPLRWNWFNENWEVFGRVDYTFEDDWYPQDDNLARIPEHSYTNVRLGLESDRYALELWVKNLFEEDDVAASFRDVFFGNTDDIYGQRAPGNDPSQFFPFRYTLNYPELRTWGVTFRARFGGA